jgi:hypothetical protein
MDTTPLFNQPCMHLCRLASISVAIIGFLERPHSWPVSRISRIPCPRYTYKPCGTRGSGGKIDQVDLYRGQLAQGEFMQVLFAAVEVVRTFRLGWYTVLSTYLEEWILPAGSAILEHWLIIMLNVSITPTDRGSLTGEPSVRWWRRAFSFGINKLPFLQHMDPQMTRSFYLVAGNESYRGSPCIGLKEKPFIKFY